MAYIVTHVATRQDAEDPFWVEIEEDVTPGITALKQGLMDAGYVFVSDTIEDSTFTRVAEFPNEDYFWAVRHVISCVLPDYYMKRYEYDQEHGHTHVTTPPMPEFANSAAEFDSKSARVDSLVAGVSHLMEG